MTSKTITARTMAEYRHLVRIANTDLKGERIIGIALTGIKGVGPRFAKAVCIAAGIETGKKTGELTDTEVKQLEKVILNADMNLPKWMFNRRKDPEDGLDKHLITNQLVFAKDTDLRDMKKLKNYRGMRHAFGLPSRGQRTRSNFRKNKGKSLGVKRKA